MGSPCRMSPALVGAMSTIKLAYQTATRETLTAIPSLPTKLQPTFDLSRLDTQDQFHTVHFPQIVDKHGRWDLGGVKLSKLPTRKVSERAMDTVPFRGNAWPAQSASYNWTVPFRSSGA